MKIYTKTGDQGQTSIIGGTRVNKNDLRIEAYGCIDELNAQLAMLREFLQSEHRREHFIDIQKHLFRISGQLATPEDCTQARVVKNYQKVSKLSGKLIQELETEIDLIEATLPPMNSFVIPGGNKASAQCHICRTVCRRAERCCVALQAVHPIDPQIIVYLNRLSDYLFVVSRKLCLNETEELYWDGN